MGRGAILRPDRQGLEDGQNMSKMVIVLWGLLFAAQAPAPASAPATYLSEAELTAALKAAAPAAPDMHTAAVKNADHYRINVVQRTKAQGAIAHPDGTEVHHIIEGAATLVTGGTIVRPANAGREGTATIEGGQSRRVAKGDVILIPAGTPHWYKDLEGTITYLEVRFDLPK
jgi:mannose-6-phosphate isomerase-like protein (cupin superfamily)